jgi:hypothetical protein
MIQTDDRLSTAEKTLGFVVGIHHPSIIVALTDKTEEIHLLADQLQDSIERAREVVAGCIWQIEALCVSFDSAHSREMINEQRLSLLAELHSVVDNYPHLTEAMSTLGYEGRLSSEITEAIRIKAHAIDRSAWDAKNRTLAAMQAESFLERINFFTHLSHIMLRAEELQMVAVAGGQSEYFAELAIKLHTTLEAAKNHFIFSRRSKTDSLREFKSSCLRAIREASPILDGLLDCKQILDHMTRVLSAISTVRLVQPPSRRFGLFPPIVGLHEERHDELRSRRELDGFS